MQIQHDYVSVGAYEMVGELESFEDYRIAFLDNKSSEELVLPSTGIITFSERIICPISPLKAIIIEGDVGNSESDKYVINIYDIKNSKEIRHINLAAFAQEKKRGCKYIVSSREDLLRSVNGAIMFLEQSSKRSVVKRSFRWEMN